MVKLFVMWDLRSQIFALRLSEQPNARCLFQAQSKKLRSLPRRLRPTLQLFSGFRTFSDLKATTTARLALRRGHL
jgi:hypothetical protein